MLGVYVHVPFCRSRCGYCDFNTYAGLAKLVEPYVAALCREIGAVHHPGARPHTIPSAKLEADTLYIGGGTPTTLSLDLLESVLSSVRQTFPSETDLEASIEANPGTVDLAYLRGLRDLGLNRISLGVQSFDDRMLRSIGRIHSSDEAVQAYALARRAGFDNVNLDLIYALPGQTLAHWKATVERALELSPDHLSLYALTLEGRTPMARAAESGTLVLPDEDAAADMYLLAEDLLGAAGYDHYEISNWCKSSPSGSFACRHNLIYWRNGNYLSFGAGAYSHWNGTRYRDVLAPRRYIRAIEERGAAFADVELAVAARSMGETMMMGLRLSEGVRLADFQARFGVSLDSVYRDELDELSSQGLLDLTPEAVRITPRGRLLANDVFVRFLDPAIDRKERRLYLEEKGGETR